MYNKIQPQQIEIHNFSSPSGDILFVKGSDYVYANLNRSLTGSFSITGGLLVNNQTPFFVPTSNTILTGANNLSLHGQSNTINGTGNLDVTSDFGIINGTNNLTLNARNASIAQDTNNCTILAGSFAGFSTGVSGSCVIKDFSTNYGVLARNQALLISFTNGVDFYSPLYIYDSAFYNNPVFFNNDIYVKSTHSGLFSGNLNVLNTIYQSGLPVATQQWTNENFTGVRSTAVYITGNQNITGSKTFNQSVNITGSTAATESWVNSRITGSLNSAVYTTGNQSITGAKTFNQAVSITGSTAATESWVNSLTTGALNTAVYITGNQSITGNKNFQASVGVSGTLTSQSFVLREGLTSVPTSSASIGVFGNMVASGDFLYFYNGASWTRFSGVSTW
jgi:hypothetical protein